MRSAKLTTRSSDTAASAIGLAPHTPAPGCAQARLAILSSAKRTGRQTRLSRAGASWSGRFRRLRPGVRCNANVRAAGFQGHAEGECEECRKKEMLQRRATGSTTPSFVPPIVQEVLGSPGHPLDGASRAYFRAALTATTLEELNPLGFEGGGVGANAQRRRIYGWLRRGIWRITLPTELRMGRSLLLTN